MDSESTDPNLMLLSLNLSDSEPEEGVAPGNPTTTTAGGATTEYQPTRAERTALSEEAFQALKRTYRPKIENGNIHTTIPLPLPPTPLPKPQAQALLHAAEELYFHRRYAEAAAFVRRVLAQEGDVDGGGADADNEDEGKGKGGDGDVDGDGGGEGEGKNGTGAGGGVGVGIGDGDGDGDGKGGVDVGKGEVGGSSKVKAKTARKGRGNGRIDGETERLLRYYLERCEARAREGVMLVV